MGNTPARLDEVLDDAERQGRCAFATSRPGQLRLQRACARGLLVRPRPGIYARQTYWDDLDPLQRALHEMRALSNLHPTWVFAGASAALAHGLEVGYEDVARLCLDVTAKMHTRSTHGFQRIIATGVKPVMRSGVRVTPLIRTIYDSLRILSFPSALAIADSCLRVKRIEAERLAINLKLACEKRRGLARVIDVISLADPRAENGGESKARAKIIQLGFAMPDLQREVTDPLDPSRTYRVDYAWDLPDGSVVYGELDGTEKYTNTQMTQGRSSDDELYRERRREAHITLNDKPVRVMRFSFAESQDDALFERLLESYGVPRTTGVPRAAG